MRVLRDVDLVRSTDPPKIPARRRENTVVRNDVLHVERPVGNRYGCRGSAGIVRETDGWMRKTRQRGAGSGQVGIARFPEKLRLLICWRVDERGPSLLQGVAQRCVHPGTTRDDALAEPGHQLGERWLDFQMSPPEGRKGAVHPLGHCSQSSESRSMVSSEANFWACLPCMAR